MKIFKRIALLLTVAACMVCAGVFASACGDDKGPDDKKATEFVVTVYYSDGETVVNGTDYPCDVQICSGSFCYPDFFKVDANGQVKINIANVDAAAEASSAEKSYVLHVWVDDEIDPLELTSDTDAKVNANKTTAKLVLKDVAAPAK